MIVIFRLATIVRLNVYTDNRWQPYSSCASFDSLTNQTIWTGFIDSASPFKLFLLFLIILILLQLILLC